jgi:hypothetical protein
MYKNEQYGNSSGAYSVKDTVTGLLRNAAAACFWAMAPGPRMLTEFGELGYDYSINWCSNGTVDPSGGCRLSPKPIHWDYLNDSTRKKLHDVYASMIQLRKTHPELDTANSLYALDGAFKYLLSTGSSVSTLVFANFDVNAATGTIPFPGKGVWHNYFGTDSILVTGHQNFTLAPGEYRVYINTNLKDTTTHDTTGVGPVSAVAARVYPNPVSNSSSVIEYDLPEAGNCSVYLVNSVGQVMAATSLGQVSSGKHLLTPAQLGISISNMPNGVYTIKILTDHGNAYTRFIVRK